MPTRTVLALATWAPLRTIRIATAIAANRLRDFIAEPRCSFHRKLTVHQRGGSDSRRNFAFLLCGQIAALKNTLGSVFPPLAVGKVGRKKDLVFTEESDLLREHWVIGFRRDKNSAGLGIILDFLLRQGGRRGHTPAVDFEVMLHSAEHVKDPFGAKLEKRHSQINVTVEHPVAYDR